MGLKTFGFTVAAAALLAGGACSSADDSLLLPTGSGTGPSAGPGGAGGGSGVGGDQGIGGGLLAGTGGAGGLDECAADEQEATVVTRPVDIVIVIDNSGSMGGEIESVQANINVNFAGIIAASGIDYRVIMLSRHGNFNGPESICVASPLSGTTCDPIPPEPAENAPVFYQHSVEIGSNDAWCKILSELGQADEFGLHPAGYEALLRPEAFKTFVVITDDRVSCGGYDDGNDAVDGEAAALQFDADLLAASPAQFGDASKRNYAFHSIIALADFDAADPSLPHPADAPIVTGKCTPGAQNPGTGYQALSKLTGGLRYPTCGLDYTTIFQKVAEGVVEGAKVDCQFPLPVPPANQELDPSTILVVYTPGDGSAAETFHQVTDATQCGPGLFYIENELITLCDEACALVQTDDAAKVKILSGCKPGDLD